MDSIIRLENVSFTYGSEQDQAVTALQEVNLSIQPGEYVVIVGHNGSGKSTLARHLNALLLPSEGNVWVKQWNTRERQYVREVRSTVGMVFQSPDNQIVATIVEEDVAFGPENLGLPHPEIVARVDWSLAQVDMTPFRHRAPHLLSGGQKQRICIAGMLAMKPEVLVLDEATAMLDPLGRREVLETVYRLNKQEGVTVIAITHYMEEAVTADRVVVMAEGRIALQGTPREIFNQVGQLRELKIDVPQITQLAVALHEQTGDFPPNILSVDEFVSVASQKISPPPPSSSPPSPPPPPSPPIIQVKELTYYYMYDTPLQVKAVEAVNLELYQGEILGIIGHTGSGKSTVIQHFNALLRPHQGQVIIFGQEVNSANLDVKSIRRRVGLVFQSPEAQLFEQYVGDDIAFGPRNLKLGREEVRQRVREAMEAVGLGFEAFKDRLTFSLSGGEMRRVALAGVLALQPEVLVLDEPTAGLDPQGRRQLLEHILNLQQAQKLTLVLISHNMEELARVCDRLCVMSEGKVVAVDTPAQIFSQPEFLRNLGLDVPPVTEAIYRLQQAGFLAGAGPALTVSQALTLLTEVRHERI